MVGTIELSFASLAAFLAIVLMVSFGVGLFAALLLIRGKTDGLYEGKVVMHGVMHGSLMKNKVSDTGYKFPGVVLNVSFKSRLHGRATLQVEDDCPLRAVLDESGVGDVWQIRLSRTKRRGETLKKTKTIDWRSTGMAAKFGGQQQKIGEP